MNKLTKSSRAILAVAMMLMVVLPSLAHDFEVDGIYYNYLDETAKTVEVTYKGDYYYVNEYTGSVTIPSSVTYNGTTYSVTSIGEWTFGLCTGLTSVTIPNSVTKIGNTAFYGCTGLISVTIPNSVTTIGNSAFLDCTGLTSVIVENGNSKYDSRNNCNAIIETSTNTLVVGCKNTIIPNSVISIGSLAFYNCTGLTAVTIPNSVTSIGESTFENCTDLTSVTIPNSVTKIGNTAFYGCTGLISVTIPNSVTSIGDKVFWSCNGLTEVTIPNSVTSIGRFAFSGCTGLTSITIPNSITSIGERAFSGCTGLTSVTIPNSVTEIGSSAFYGCTDLTVVNYNAENCTSIGSSDESVFRDCSNLKTINIGNEVKTIPSYAFYYCTGLTSITIPNSVTSIGSDAFWGCSGLTSVNISDLSAWCKIDFSTYDSNPLYYAKKLKLNGTEINDLVIPNDVTEIKNYTFHNCTGLTAVTIPNSVTSIGDQAFEDCTGLTEVAIGNSVTSIGNDAFWNCRGLTSITIPNSVTTIGDNAFYYCSGLTSVIIGNSVASIGSCAFYYCSRLKTITSLNPIPPTCSNNDSFSSDNYTEATLYVPKDSFAKYFVDDVWGQFTNIKKIETLVSSITLNKTALTLNSRCDYTLKATKSPSNATIPNLSWESENPTIATVDQYGKVTGISVGTATITVRANDGSNVSATCKVTVNRITLSQTEATLPVNEIMTLSYSITNSTKTVTWSTSDANVAYVKTNRDGSATIVGMADGVAIITATLVENGVEYSASCIVTVGTGTSGVEGVEVDSNAIEIARYDIHGRLLSEPTPGINIVKYNDGTTRKEFVKNLYY